MKKVIPTFYSEYGRYISRFRMIPLDIDGLLPVERRLLLVMYEIARNKLVKSAKIVGQLIGTYHPHGDVSAYGSLVNLVRSGFGDATKSTWGGPGLEDTSAPAMRYTETKLEEWVNKFAFEYLNFVPWEVLEFENEPLYLPCALPMGLIGEGVINGISFHRTIIPKYTKQSLAMRLIWLLENGMPELPKNWDKKMDEDKFGPKIIPNKDGCDLNEGEPNSFYKILLTGEGIVKYSPQITIEQKNKKDFLVIHGRAPNATFDPLLRAYEKNKLNIADRPTDQSKKNKILIQIEPKKNTNIKELMKTLQENYLNKNVNFKCYFSNLQGVVHQLSIDKLLLNCFERWKEAFSNKLDHDIIEINEDIIDNIICADVKNILHNHKQIMSIGDIIKNFNFEKPIGLTIIEENNWKDIKVPIKPERVIEVCKRVTIQKLIEFQSVEEQLKEKFKQKKQEIENKGKLIISRIKDLIK